MNVPLLVVVPRESNLQIGHQDFSGTCRNAFNDQRSRSASYRHRRFTRKSHCQIETPMALRNSTNASDTSMLKACAPFRAIASSLCVAFATALSACGGGTGSATEDASNVVLAASTDPTADSMATASRYHPPKGGATAGALTVGWVAPTLSADGSPLTDLVGFRILVGTASGTYSNVVTVSDPAAVSYAFSGLPTGTYYVVVKAFDTANNESLPSAELSKAVR
jgi:hypothetical protein